MSDPVLDEMRAYADKGPSVPRRTVGEAVRRIERAESILSHYLNDAWIGHIEGYDGVERPVMRMIGTVYLTEEELAYALALKEAAGDE